MSTKFVYTPVAVYSEILSTKCSFGQSRSVKKSERRSIKFGTEYVSYND